MFNLLSGALDGVKSEASPINNAADVIEAVLINMFFIIHFVFCINSLRCGKADSATFCQDVYSGFSLK